MLTVYQSSAGAGKTFTLAQNYIHLLFAAHAARGHRHVLAVTFTKKATAEMKHRIVEELGLLATGAPSNYQEGLMKRFALSAEEVRERSGQILRDLLQDYSAFAVTTIDSFFQQIIRSFARELNLSGAYNVELDSNQILNRAVDDLFFHLPQHLDDEVSKALISIIEDNLENEGKWDPKEKILSLSRELLKEVWQKNYPELETVLQKGDVLNDYKKTLRQIEQDYYAELRSLEKQLETALGGVEETEFPRGRNLFSPFHYKKKEIVDAYNGKKKMKTLRDFIENEASSLSGKKAFLQPVWERVLPLATRLMTLYSGEPALQVRTAVAAGRYLSYLTVLENVQSWITSANRELNRLPIAQTNALINKVVEEEDAPFIYDKIGVRLSHYMIDEFQDTSAMQWRNFRPLIKEANARGGGNLIVGDVKQSIYRWRNSDLTLLQSGVKEDFSLTNEDVVNLKNNWRSDACIVDFNNSVFAPVASDNSEPADGLSLVGILQQELNTKLEISPSADGALNEVYSSVFQHPMKHKEQGYVKVRFQRMGTKKKCREEVLAKLPDLCNDLRKRGIPLGRVALLVRNNSDAAPVAAALVSAGIGVMSNEGLLLTASPEVRVCIGILRLSLTPDDALLRLQLNYDFRLTQGVESQKALEAALNTPLDDRVENLIAQPHEGLYQYIEHLIRVLNLEEKPSALAYLQGLRDCVYAYTQRYQSDVSSFLNWWNTTGNRTALQMQEAADSVQIVTIHKSKGLEYDVVIIPFCDWDTSESPNPNREDILWVKPTTAPHNRLPLLPLKFEKKLSKTIFAQDWKEEMEKLYIDNLNLTYVAFTRAKRELYIFAPACSEENPKLNATMGAMLYKVLENALTDDCYIQGQKVQGSGSDHPADNMLPFSTVSPELLSAEAGQVKIHLSSGSAFVREGDGLNNTLNLGIVMHNLLGEVRYWQETEQVVQRYAQSGMLTTEDVLIVQTELLQLQELTRHTDWFSGEWQILTEQDIMLADGTTRRPDRIMIKGNECVVVDWKFGHSKRSEYQVQVRDYMNLLQAMGYEVKGYLCYVNQKEIEEVI